MKWKRKATTQPICLYCWYASETKVPKCVTDGAPQRCCDCGRVTRDGLFVERDPTTVYWPAYETGEE